MINVCFKMYIGDYAMDEFIKKFDQNLDYLDHEITEDEVLIYAASNRKTCYYFAISKLHSFDRSISLGRKIYRELLRQAHKSRSDNR